MTPIRVLLADDEAVIRESLRLLVDSDEGMSVSAVASDGDEAIRLVTVHQPDVVLMDVQMPGKSGLEVARLLAERGDGAKIIILTTFDLDEYVYEALRAGAAGFLLKNSRPAAILDAIRVVHDGHALLAPEVTKRLIARFARRRGDDRLGRLTSRERETLVLIGRGLSNAEIASSLVVTQTTVRTYVSRVLTKLDARDRAGLVVLAYETGIVGV